MKVDLVLLTWTCLNPSAAVNLLMTGFEPTTIARPRRPETRPGEEEAGETRGGKGHHTWDRCVGAPPDPGQVRSSGFGSGCSLCDKQLNERQDTWKLLIFILSLFKIKAANLLRFFF